MFLLELDSETYADQIVVLLEHIQERQQASGAWGYRKEQNLGDTSQMQYVALALWLAGERGFDVDYGTARDALQWMIDTQQDDGGWWYKSPVDPRAVNRELSQTSRPPLVAAGLGTVYLYADLLRLVHRAGTPGVNVSTDSELPGVVIDVTDEDHPETTHYDSGPRVKFDRARMGRTMNDGNRWFAENFSPQCEHYNMYYLYGYERYATLREYVEGENRDVPNWYDQGVGFLKQIQGDDGSLVKGATSEVSANIQTALAILFLTRSMSITLGNDASNVLHGSHGLPENAFLQVHGDKIVPVLAENSLEGMFLLLDNPDDDQWRYYLNSLSDLALDGDEVSRNQQLSTLRGLVSHPNATARLIAVRFLSRFRSLENVPAFIYALTDPDPEVVVAAQEALRYVSRKPDVEAFTENTAASQVDEARRMWKRWFNKVKPDGILLDEPR